MFIYMRMAKRPKNSREEQWRRTLLPGEPEGLCCCRIPIQGSPLRVYSNIGALAFYGYIEMHRPQTALLWAISTRWMRHINRFETMESVNMGRCGTLWDAPSEFGNLRRSTKKKLCWLTAENGSSPPTVPSSGPRKGQNFFSRLHFAISLPGAGIHVRTVK